jgi:glycosyltransferase involved in cell wall biosynthesis
MLLLLGNIDREVLCKENVICFPGVPHEKIWIYLAASDIFVYPSCTETQGIAVSEAMACGLPIVVVNEGGAHEAIEHNISGQKVPNKVEEFASAMERFIQFPDFAQKCGAAAKNKIENDFVPEVIYPKIIELYQQVISSVS